MLNTTSKSGVISFKIWFFALLFNTVIGSFILGGFTGSCFVFFIYGTYFAAIFSFPIFIILWVLLKYLLSNGFTCSKIVGRLLLTGGLLSILTFICFFYIRLYMPGNPLLLGLLAVISGIIGIVSQINFIKNVCEIRDNEFTIDEPTTI